ncbi:MAG: ATP-binding protein [Planctomycetes bacterium]|nr:ATP-binding protein [Planctomycetota bacterium]
MQVIRRAARDLTSADGVTFVLRDGDQCYYAEENAIAPLWKGMRFPMSACISGWTMLHRQEVVIEDIYADPRIPADAYRPTFVKSLAMVPVRREDPLAAIGAYWASNHKATERELYLLQSLADSTALALANVELYQDLTRKAEEAAGLYQRAQQEIATREQLETELWHAQKMEAIGQLAGGIAHDFNNLLTVICGYSRLALDNARGDENLRRQIEEIGKAGERATSLTRQLLAFSRKQVLQPKVLNLNEVVAQADSMLRRLIGEDIDIVTKLEPNLDPVRFDPGQIDQILMNLAVNARDAMPQGGKLTIETDNIELDEEYARTHADARKGPHVMIAVTDTGTGMDAQTLNRIFEPFFTTKGVGKGTGLGLSTVYGIVKQSGGNIWVYSEPGRGTTFKIYLPCAEEAASPRDRSAGRPPVPLGKGKILVVEDDENVRALIQDVLESGGYTVIATGNPQEALAACDQHAGEIRLLLTDVVMPGMGGRELSEKLVAKWPAMKVVFMSGYTDNAIVHHGVLDPGLHFIEKPILPKVLLERIADFLEAP